jgi:predicted aspartyl protease
MPTLIREPPNMGRIYVNVTVTNARDESKSLQVNALVDTGASHLVLPLAWKDQLGELELLESPELETATQSIVQGEVYGPVTIQIAGFRAVYSEVLFIEMTPHDGEFEVLLGYIPLEQAGAAVDVLRHRLMHIKHFDLK